MESRRSFLMPVGTEYGEKNLRSSFSKKEPKNFWSLRVFARLVPTPAAIKSFSLLFCKKGLLRLR